MTMSANRPMSVLLVEDNEGDVLLTREAFEDGRVAVDLHVAEDGAAALAHLREAVAGGSGAPTVPDLVLLDWNLPGLAGVDVLRTIRRDDRLRHLPVVVLTTSRAPEDILTAYREHASSFISKPVDAEEFLRAIRAIESYWLTIARLPGAP